MSQDEFRNTELQLSAALHCFWQEMMRPLILEKRLSDKNRLIAEEFGGALLAVSSCHKVLSGLVSEQSRQFPDALLEVLPSMRDSYVKYTRLFQPSCLALDLICQYGTASPNYPEFAGVDMSPSSVVAMPMQVLPKYTLLLKDAAKEGGFAEASVRRALEGIDAICRELEWLKRAAHNAERISALNAIYGFIFGDDDIILDDAYFVDSPAGPKGRARRVLLCESRIVVVTFKDKDCLRYRSSFSIPLVRIQSVRNNPALGCLDMELQEREKLVTMQLFSDDTLLLSQWVLGLSLAIDRATNPV